LIELFIERTRRTTDVIHSCYYGIIKLITEKWNIDP